jgi:glycosyltransferase involved in cell wall biosynthesis
VIYTIIPCHNEENNIEKVLEEADKSMTDKILVVDNGSFDRSHDIVKNFPSEKIDILFFNIALGHDVPRAIGLNLGLSDGGKYFIFIDGDMTGITKDDINSLILALESGVDLALTNCYYDNNLPDGLARYVLYFRKMLNSELGVFDKIKYSTPSHGPHGISRALAASVPIEYVSIPSLLLSYAVKNGFNVDIELKKLHKDIVCQEKSSEHALDMAETLIGDCISGIKFVRGEKISREFEGIEYTGYHKKRRFDVLELVLGHKVSV